MLEELQRMWEDQNENLRQKVVVILAHLSSIVFYVCDHLLWIIQLRIIKLEELRYRNLKIVKNWGSFLRMLLQFQLDWWQFQRDSKRQDLLLKFIENAANIFIAAKGMQVKPVCSLLTRVDKVWNRWLMCTKVGLEVLECLHLLQVIIPFFFSCFDQMGFSGGWRFWIKIKGKDTVKPIITTAVN